MTVLDVRFSDWIQRGITLFIDNAVLLILSGAAAMAISGVTLGLLTGPMLAGMSWIIAQLMDERLAKPSVNDLFRGFDHVVPTIPVTAGFYVIAAAGYVASLLPAPGFVLNAVVVSVGGAIGVLCVFHLVVRKTLPRESAVFWWELFKANWGPLLGFFILLALIGGSGALLLFVGLVVTVPLYLCIMGVAFDSMLRQSAEG